MAKPPVVDPPAHPRSRKWYSPSRLVIELLLMVIGAIVGIATQRMLAPTGILGPSIEAVIANQTSNFDEIHATLEALAKNTDPAERARLQQELAGLIASQEKLIERTHVELREYQAQLAKARDEALAARGSSAGGADFWLQVGESATVGKKGNVVGLTAKNATQASVNHDGRRRNMNPGDSFEIPMDGKVGKLVFRQIKDDRAGFDFVLEER